MKTLGYSIHEIAQLSYLEARDVVVACLRALQHLHASHPVCSLTQQLCTYCLAFSHKPTAQHLTQMCWRTLTWCEAAFCVVSAGRLDMVKPAVVHLHGAAYEPPLKSSSSALCNAVSTCRQFCTVMCALPTCSLGLSLFYPTWSLHIRDTGRHVTAFACAGICKL